MRLEPILHRAEVLLVGALMPSVVRIWSGGEGGDRRLRGAEALAVLAGLS